MIKEKQLQKGLLTTQEFAEWRGIKTSTLGVAKKKYLEELKSFASFHINKHRIYIDEVYEPTYRKEMSKNRKKVMQRIDATWSKDGLDSCSRVGAQIAKELREQDKSFDLKDSTVIQYTINGRNELWGKPFMSNGPQGYCEYVWCKRDPATGRYSLLTEEEEKKKNQITTKYFGTRKDKDLLVQSMINNGQITEEEAWGVYQRITGLTSDRFKAWLDEVRLVLNAQLVKATQVYRSAFSDDNKKGPF